MTRSTSGSSASDALSGKVALVTGGSRGIGLAIAHALRHQGADVAILGTTQDALSKAAAELDGGGAGSGAGVLPIRADVRDHGAVQEAVAAVVSHFGGLDILINNAGIGVFKTVADMTPEEWQQVLDTNLSGVFHCCHAAIPHLKTRGGGWILNISSLSSKNPSSSVAAYSASKAALNAFSEALMQEVRYDGIRVAYVLPGSVQTGFSGLPNTKAGWALLPEDVAEVIVDLLQHPARSLPSRVEIRPAQPPRKG